jgi:ribonuclease P protein component
LAELLQPGSVVKGSEVATRSVPEGAAVGARAVFPRAMRVLRHGDFERVYKRGKRFFAAHMTVFYLRRDQEERARFGFTVGKFLGGAVERNRIKRRLREAVRLHASQLNAPVDVILNPKKSALTADFAQLENDITRAFEVIAKPLPAK